VIVAVLAAAAGCSAARGLPEATPTASAGAGIAGVKDFHKDDPTGRTILSRDHVPGPVKYPMSPPAGGKHNPYWQNCEGDVYAAPVPNERAVHSLEHGAVWITYRPDLPKSGVDALAKYVRGVGYTLMSPYEGLDTAVSVQAWGVQLKVSSPTDKRIRTFLAAYRERGPESGATCSSGITSTEPGVPGDELNPPTHAPDTISG
jgi:hypothetical protein